MSNPRSRLLSRLPIFVLAAAGLWLLLGALLLSLPTAEAGPLRHGTPTPGAPAGVPGEVPAADHHHALAENPTYYEHVEPILQLQCVGCHTGGGIGEAVFDMSETLPVLEAHEDIARVVWAGAMPPWMPGEGSPQMRHARGLSDAERDTILAWAEQGAPLGDAARRPAESSVPEPITIQPDVVVSLPEPYTPDDARPDDYRCFLIDLDLPEDRYIAAFNIEPDQASIVHHVVVYQIDEASRQVALNRDAEDERSGWECFGGPGVGGGGGLRDAVGTWTPGAVPTIYPAGTGRRLRAAGLLVLQVHYNLEAGAAPDQTRVVFELVEAGQSVQPIELLVLFGPVEIPCPADNDSPECDRETMLARTIAAGNLSDVRTTMGLLQFCDREPEDFINQDASHVVSTCEFTLPVDVTAVGTAAHMHTRGASFLLEVNPDTDAAQTMLDIPAWDFNWQGEYFYEEAIPLERGDTVRLTCVWDNSDGDRYIIWGEGTDDEMCIGWLAVVAD